MLFETYRLIATEPFGPARTAFVEAFCIHGGSCMSSSPARKERAFTRRM
jgi:hypothetical protein